MPKEPGPYTINGEAYDEWLQYRKSEKKKPVGSIAQHKQLLLLSQYPHDVQQAIIDTSINCGWQGLFPPKGGADGRQTGRPAHPRGPATISASTIADAGDVHNGRPQPQLFGD